MRVDTETADGRGFTSQRHFDSIRMAAHLSAAHPEALRAMWRRVLVRPNASPTLEDFLLAHGRVEHPEIRTDAGRETWLALGMSEEDDLKGEACLLFERLRRLASVGHQVRTLPAHKRIDPRVAGPLPSSNPPRRVVHLQ